MKIADNATVEEIKIADNATAGLGKSVTHMREVIFKKYTLVL